MIASVRVALLLPAVVAALLGTAGTTAAQTDEIQVYDAALAEPGTFNLMLHNNFTPDGLRSVAFPGGIVPDKSFNGVPEWAYGITNWWEAGLYLPLYSFAREDGNRHATIDGVKLRLLFAVPHAADRTFFYGANFEFSYNARQWDPARLTSEVRPIVGWHLHPVDIIVNPILDTSYDGLKNIAFAPAARVAYNLSAEWAVALEEYADVGPLTSWFRAREQTHQVFGVFDHASKLLNIEAGVGFGLTPASSRLTLKLMLSRDLN